MHLLAFTNYEEASLFPFVRNPFFAALSSILYWTTDAFQAICLHIYRDRVIVFYSKFQIDHISPRYQEKLWFMVQEFFYQAYFSLIRFDFSYLLCWFFFILWRSLEDWFWRWLLLSLIPLEKSKLCERNMTQTLMSFTSKLSPFNLSSWISQSGNSNIHEDAAAG